ncbi:MAG TPA: PIN domain nuclease [Lentisphaeria bacterium]|nr:MAG: hypothetical protein A2X45_06820 [Lentisphaerae bacterium GWF2_50_93]HCE43372.1 PIN domain nuclease [Lentisphaeria bacterium]
MNLIIDTHALIWAAMDTGKLSDAARTNIIDRKNNVHVSVVSFFEISLKYSMGRLELKGILPDDFPEISSEMGFSIQELSAETVSTFYKLPKTDNKDPFDRLIAWEAIRSGMVLVSRDKGFESYGKFGLRTLW